MNFQVVQQFEEPVGVNCNFTHWSESESESESESLNLNLNLNSLLVKRQIDNPSPGAVTGGN